MEGKNLCIRLKMCFIIIIINKYIINLVLLYKVVILCIFEFYGLINILMKWNIYIVLIVIKMYGNYLVFFN